VDTASSAFNVLFEGVRAVSEVMPGGGMLRAAGDFAVQLARRGVSTGADMAKGLIDAGVPEGDARRYGDAFASGGILVTVQAKTDKTAQCVRKVMASRGATVTA
jgi:hypothetical protein